VLTPASFARLGPVDGGEKGGPFVGAVYREALPFSATAQIGEKTGGILMKMQKCLAADIEYSWPALDEGGPASETL